MTTLTFQNTSLATIEHNNQIWLTSTVLAKALQYASRKSVTDLYNKNSDEFTINMSEVVESTTSGNYRKKTRIFSLRGAHLIAMFSRTAVAKEFRKWVLDILDRETRQETKKGTFVDDNQLYAVYFLMNHFNHLNETFNRYNLYVHLSGLGCKAAAEMSGHFLDGQLACSRLKELTSKFENAQIRLGLNTHPTTPTVF